MNNQFDPPLTDHTPADDTYLSERSTCHSLPLSKGDNTESSAVCKSAAQIEIRKKSNEQGLIIFSKPPYGAITAQEGQDLAMAASAFYPNLAILFLGDGLLNCLNTQTPVDSLKPFCKTFSAFPLYDIQHLYATQQDCDQFGLKTEDLNLPLQFLDHIGLQSLLQSVHWILHY